MEVVNGLKALKAPLGRSVVTIGNFDGVHLGHQGLISQLIETARKFKAPSVVLTFDPHPSRVLRPTSPVPRLFSRKDLEKKLTQMQVDYLVVEPFTVEFAGRSPEEFVKEDLVGRFHPVAVLVGHDFQFGRNREGSFSLLKKIGETAGFTIEQLKPVLWNNEVVSSSRIRHEIAVGQVDVAQTLLGRPYYISGEIVAGESRGTKLGFPTANVQTDAEILPQNGVYLTNFISSGVTAPSLTNVGTKPTFHTQHAVTVESHVLAGQKDYRGQHVQVEFLKRLRNELKFPSADALIKQIGEDVQAAKKYFGI